VTDRKAYKIEKISLDEPLSKELLESGVLLLRGSRDLIDGIVGGSCERGVSRVSE